MDDTDSAYCRFCAKFKPYGKLVNFQRDKDRLCTVMEKLSRLSLGVANFNTLHDPLPKTVCFLCIESLDNAFEFILSVEASQSKFGAFGSDTIKQEFLNDKVTNSTEERSRASTIKIEVEVSDTIETQDANTKNNKEILKEDININKKSKRKDRACLQKIQIVDSEISWINYSWLCAYCDVMFPCIEELKEHSMHAHGCCNPYRCTDCKARKLNLDNFIKHVKQHRNNLKLSCYKCHKIFPRQYDTIIHKKEHIATEFKCPGCNETFTTKEESHEHCNLYNKDRKIREVPPEHLTDDLKCVFCDKQFCYKGGLTTHLLTQHREKKRDHTCDKCGKCFLNKTNLARHMFMHDDIQPYKCEICKHCFRQRSQLSRHMGIHDGKKPFACDQCGRRFRLKKQLSTHSIVHTDKFPYICSYCQKGFKYKSTFIQHVRLHTGERPYKCEVCHREFTNWPNYNKHMKRRHGMNMAKSQQLLEHSTTANLDVELATDLTMKNRNIFVPKHRGRPKITSSIKKKIPHNEIKTEVA